MFSLTCTALGYLWHCSIYCGVLFENRAKLEEEMEWTQPLLTSVGANLILIVQELIPLLRENMANWHGRSR